MKLVANRTVQLAAVVDIVLVVVFVLIGRASHGESLLGTLNTLWPFIVGLAAGWAIARAWRNPLVLRLAGLTIWLSTVVVGMLLRLVSHQGIELPFIIVTTVVLGIFLLGWRPIARRIVSA